MSSRQTCRCRVPDCHLGTEPSADGRCQHPGQVPGDSGEHVIPLGEEAGLNPKS